jgi:adenosylcobinamide kinase/adenosylcobinamide-phosphate guanylyltransferase
LIHLVTGGARCGKSRFAQVEVESLPGGLVFLATAQARDADMQARIARHREERGGRWRSWEEPLDLVGAIRGIDAAGQAPPVLVDCLTMWVANLVFADRDDASILAAGEDLALALAARQADTVVVTNEVGWGIVPDNALSRRYRDLLGRCNQSVAARADRVSLMVAGLPVRVR